MDKIKVIDKFLSTDELNNALSIINAKAWTLQVSDETSKTRLSTQFLFMNLKNETFFTDHIRALIERATFKKFEIL